MANIDNNLIKNRYYVVIRDDIPYAYLSVKKDFYTEGYLIDQKAILVGYFKMYQSLDVHIISSCENQSGVYLNGLSIISRNGNGRFDISGDVSSADYHLYKSNLDEYCDHILGEEADCKIQIKQIEDTQDIKNINYLIRSSLRNLTGVHKQYYEILKRHRYGNLKEFLSGVKTLSENVVDLGISNATINDLKLYLNFLSSSLKNDNPSEKISKKEQKSGKRKVKRKGKKAR